MPILKMLSRRSISGLKSSLLYVTRDGKSKDVLEATSNPLLHNLRSEGNDIQAIIQEFTNNESYRKVTSNRVYFYHTILSLSEYDQESVTPEMMKSIAKKFFSLRGDVLSYCVAHYDDNPHLHFIESATRYRENKSSTLRKTEMLKLKQDVEYFMLTEFPELEHSFVQHGQGKAYVSEKEYQAAMGLEKKKKFLRKDEVRDIILFCFHHAKSKTHFIQLLNENELLHYERNQDGIPTGIIDPKSGIKYRFSRLAGISTEDILSLGNLRQLDQNQSIDF